jgi:hypothetical protein
MTGVTGMKEILLGALLVCLIQTSGGSGDPSVKMSIEPLDAEQVGVYQAFLQGYLEGDRGTINLAENTISFAPDKDDFDGCMKGFPATKPLTEVHSLRSVFAANKKVRLVDPETHQIRDPGDAIRQGQSVDDAVNAGFNAGLLTLSEIGFNAKRERAALRYSFHCGRLCGHGGTVLFEKKDGKWVRSKKSCGSWMS